jgi:hypothetical protein
VKVLIHRKILASNKQATVCVFTQEMPLGSSHPQEIFSHPQDAQRGVVWGIPYNYFKPLTVQAYNLYVNTSHCLSHIIIFFNFLFLAEDLSSTTTTTKNTKPKPKPVIVYTSSHLKRLEREARLHNGGGRSQGVRRC